MKLTHIKAPQALAASALEDRGPAPAPIGEATAHIRSRAFHEEPRAGVWECSPGKWRRQVKSAEFSHFIAGRCIFHADSGEKLEISAGDAVVFPPNTTGVWEILEPTRKTFVLL